MIRNNFFVGKFVRLKWVKNGVEVLLLKFKRCFLFIIVLLVFKFMRKFINENLKNNKYWCLVFKCMFKNMFSFYILNI